MAIDKGESLARKGMNRDSHPSEVSKEEYTFAMNANISDENGNGQVILQNENSNIKCTGFKVGYKVIGFKYDQNRNKTYFFSLNETTGCSEIGYVDMPLKFDGQEAVESQCGCDFNSVLEKPLEDIPQNSYCIYNTLIYDCCTDYPDAPKCLNFNINYPIYESNIQIKDEVSGYTMYFTDNYNPQRYIKLDEIDYYYQIDEPCLDAEKSCLQCDKMLIFKPFNVPCITPEIIGSGGNLRASTYEFFLAYCSQDGDELSNYDSYTNPVPIFDMNNRILAQPNLDYNTDKSIYLSITNLDTSFQFYKVIVHVVHGLGQNESFKTVGIYPTTTSSVVVADIGKPNESDDPSRDLLSMRMPQYQKAKGLSSGNGYLFHYGLTEHREMNLQPIVNLLGAFVKWGTYQTKENVYQDGVNVANYTGYMRDEVYPLSIRFFTDGGYSTRVLPFIARPPKTTDLEEYVSKDGVVLRGGLNVESITHNLSKCIRDGRRFKWQFENTATVDEVPCLIPSNIETITYTVVNDEYCTVMDGTDPKVIDTVASGQVIIPNNLTLIDYINGNKDNIVGFTDASWASIIAVLTGSYATDNCVLTVGDNCDTPTLISEEIVALTDATETEVKIAQPLTDYDEIGFPEACDIVEQDLTGPKPLRDEDFETSFMSGTKVYKRKPVNNTDCSSVIDLVPPSQANMGFYLPNEGTNVADTSLLTTINADPMLPDFYDKVTIGAIWFRIDFQGEDKMIFQMSGLQKEKMCEYKDKNTGGKIRISFFKDCTSTGLVSAYTQFVTAPTTSEILLVLDSADFPSGEAYVAVDAQLVARTGSWTLAPPCSCFSMTAMPEVYSLEVSFTGLEFGKNQVYSVSCEYSKPDLDNCKPVPYQKGDFSYWESVLKYPCNKELWDSSDLIIYPSNIPIGIRDTFEDYFVDSISGTGEYVLSQTTNFQDKPIRHYKFPCNVICPFINTDHQKPINFEQAIVYPIGFNLDNETINAFLDIALLNKLISPEERKSISRYEIYRGERTSQKSIVAKGIVFDYYTYDELSYGATTEKAYYSNYPLNTLGMDLQNGQKYPDRQDGSNHLYAFHSPETHFYKPTLPTEIKVEGHMFGKSLNYYDEVLGHPKFVILGNKAYNLAAGLAVAEIAFELLIKYGELFASGFGSLYGSGSILSGVFATALLAGMALSTAFKWGKYREEWVQSFRKLGRPYQFAYYNVAIGNYNYLTSTPPLTNSMYRGLASSQYIKNGRFKSDNKTGVPPINVNNEQREHHLMLNMGANYYLSHPLDYVNYDNGNVNSATATRGLVGYKGIGKSAGIVKNTAVPYMSIKQYLPAQYGDIYSTNWVGTAYCGVLSELEKDCDTIFGGDVYISRFSVKRKFPFFLTTAIGLPDNTPFEYKSYFNIPYDSADFLGRYYINYLVNSEVKGGALGKIFPTNKDEYNLENTPMTEEFYVNPPSKFYLYSFGIPYFLVESTFNCNYRYAGTSLAKDFYPHHSDVIELTQPMKVPISEEERFYINDVYFIKKSLKNTSISDPLYRRDKWDVLSTLDNSVIWSKLDSTDASIDNPWLTYGFRDSYLFDKENGKLVDISLIENKQMFARFRNGFSLFNAVDNISDRLTTSSNPAEGAGGIFSGRNMNFYSTKLGHAGSQNVAMVSCKYGHFWADAIRGNVFMMATSSSGSYPEQITQGLTKWFKENLPFKVLSVSGMTEEDIDNPYNKVGLTMGWDERNNRVFLTKKDYKPISNKITFVGGDFYADKVKISLHNPLYFKDCSWTVGYNPLLKTWVSYYSFKPNFYIGYNEYFQTGISDDSGSSLWSHVPFEGSHQVFYGNIYPFTVEYPVVTKGAMSSFNYIEYWLDIRKYYNKYDFSDIVDNGFNRAVVYKNDQNTGEIQLKLQTNNDLSQLVNYPKYNSTNTEVLQTEIGGKWTFNFLYNRIKNEKSGLPLWLYDLANVEKFLDNKLIDYRNSYQDRLRGDYFLVRLTQDVNSRYKYIFRYAIDERNYYYQ